MSDDDDDLAAEVRRLRSEVATLRRRVADLEAAVDGESTAATRTDRDAVDDRADRAPSDETTPREDDTAAHDREQERTQNWERDIGIKWLGLLGGAALVAGVVFFVRLAIEAGLLGPLGRVVAGTVAGVALFAGGRFAAERQGYVRWGQIAAGVGLAIAYFSCYAAYGFEAYRTALGTPLWAVLAALTILVAGTAAVSVRDGAPIVAGEAFLFGYGTAYLGLEAETFVVTPAYALLLAVGLVAIAAVRPWYRLVLASVLPTYGLVAVWRAETEPAASLAAAVVVAALGIYLVGGYVLRRADADGRWYRPQIGALTVLNAGIGAVFLEDIVTEWVPEAPLEGVALGAVGLALVGVYAITDRRPVRRDEAAGALAVVLLGGAVVLAAEPFGATVGLLALLCGSIFGADRTDAPAFRTGGHLVALGTVGKLLAVDAAELPAFDTGAPLATATGRPVAFALAVAVFYGLALRFRGETMTTPRTGDSVPVAAPYAVAGTGLTVVVLGLELSGAGVSVAWAAFGLALVTAGLSVDVRGLRFQGMAVLGLVTAKVFLFDMQGLDAIARALAFLVVGAILLAASYAYARWQGEDPLRRLTGE
ncbi:DUF2339 domain-containing protein [Halopiger aswanensis]|uniref:Putative membrane protein DUF2339 n=1 Tax=Halopiger aswanensis TaxID=148449 RepID=A0A419WEU2_9EURY|nr:DUF2339 domain-containing protein [Halopiger aswanensis]RKD93965.1 putative membrane protein DUF2339 [Halopiger aswanensis]